MKIKRLFDGFSGGELILWCSSVFFIVISFIIFDRENFLTLSASLIGATSLIFCAKGNPAGPILLVAFSLLYGIISFSFFYYGEMITYLGMSAPMSVCTLVAWLRNPSEKNSAEVKVNCVKTKEIIFMLALSGVVTFVFYFILEVFNTANLLLSTISITTSFIAAYLTLRRSPYYALAYAANDIVLIALWIMAAMSDISYLSVTVCFVIFLINDLYGFINWRRMQKRQQDYQEIA